MACLGLFFPWRHAEKNPKKDPKTPPNEAKKIELSCEGFVGKRVTQRWKGAGQRAPFSSESARSTMSASPWSSCASTEEQSELDKVNLNKEIIDGWVAFRKLQSTRASFKHKQVWPEACAQALQQEDLQSRCVRGRASRCWHG